MRKHAEMIKAWADNEELVVFYKHAFQGWIQTNPSWAAKAEYFACLPQHAEVCHHWLNGGEVQRGYNTGYKDYSPLTKWIAGSVFMNPDASLRIKPKKEKRWIATDGSRVNPTLFLNEPSAYEDWQVIEIEVEV